MPDPQWRKQEARREEDQVTVFLERGNHVQGLMRFSNGANDWTMAIYDAESGECLPVNDDVLECRSEDGEINACFEPRSHEAIVQLSGPGGARISLPMTIEEEEQALCILGSPAQVNASREEENPTPERTPDHLLLIVEGDPNATYTPGTFYETTAANLGLFLVEKRKDVPGVLQDLKTVAEHLREFGAQSFYVQKYPAKGYPDGRPYLIFKGNPRKPGKHFGPRDLIRSFGKYTFENPKVAQLGFGAKNALKNGGRATVISFVIVAGMDVLEEVVADEPSLARLGVTLGSDAAKLAILDGGGGVGERRCSGASRDRAGRHGARFHHRWGRFASRVVCWTSARKG